MNIEELISYIDENGISRILVTGPTHSGSEDIARMLTTAYGYRFFDSEIIKEQDRIGRLFRKYDCSICHLCEVTTEVDSANALVVMTLRPAEDIELDRQKQHFTSKMRAQDYYKHWDNSGRDFIEVDWEDYRIVCRSPIYGFYHVAFIGKWQEIFDEQVQDIQKSGILDVTDKLYIGCLGDVVHLDKVRDAFPDAEIFHDATLTLYEMFTLSRMQQLSYTEDFQCWYIHTKGASGRWPQFSTAWRRYMTKHVLYDYERCLDYLSYYDCTGASYDNVPVRYFQGNFWWSKSGHIKTLGNLYTQRIIDYNKKSERNHIRMNAEFWFSTNPDTNGCSLFSVHIANKTHRDFLMKTFFLTPQWNVDDSSVGESSSRLL